MNKTLETIYAETYREAYSKKYDADFHEYKHSWSSDVKIRNQPDDREVFNSKLVAEKIRQNTNVWFYYYTVDGHYDGGVYVYYMLPDELFPEIDWDKIPDPSHSGSRLINDDGKHYFMICGLRNGPCDPKETGVWGVYRELVKSLPGYWLSDDKKKFKNVVGSKLPNRRYYSNYNSEYIRYDDGTTSTIAAGLTQSELDSMKWMYEHRAEIIKETIDAYKDAVAYWYELRDAGTPETNKHEPKLRCYGAYINGDELVVMGKTKQECYDNAVQEGYDNEEFQINPIYEGDLDDILN